MQRMRPSRRLLVVLSSLFFFLMSVAALLLSSSYYYSTEPQPQPQPPQAAVELLPPSPPALPIQQQQQEQQLREAETPPPLVQPVPPPAPLPPSHEDEDLNAAVPHDHVFDTAHGHVHEVLSAEQQALRETQRKAELERMVLCLRWRREFGIVSNASWGRATAEAQAKWTQNRCDAAVSVAAYREYLEQHPELFAPIVIPPSRVSPAAKSSELEVIAICVCTTTRGLRVGSLDDLMLFKSLLPSIAQYVEPGYEYWIYLLYDEGDEFFDRLERLSAVRSWFEQFVVAPLSAKSIHSRLLLTAFQNTQHKPGPAFNFLTHLAFIDGADWLYRINDDSLFMSPFASALVAAQRAFGPPFGAVGPLCRDGNIHILTHDFTSRLHHQIFGRHYPPMLTDWWMDDWITRVYGRRRTRRVDEVVVRHLLRSHGTRYNVDFNHEDMLDQEVELSRQAVEHWMRQQSLTNELQLYQHDEFKFKLA